MRSSIPLPMDTSHSAYSVRRRGARSPSAIRVSASRQRICHTSSNGSILPTLPVVAIPVERVWDCRLHAGSSRNMEARSRLRASPGRVRSQQCTYLFPVGLHSLPCPLLSKPSARPQPDFSNVCHAVIRKEGKTEMKRCMNPVLPGEIHSQDSSAEMTEGEQDEEPTYHIACLRLELRWRRGAHYRACSGPDARGGVCVRQSSNRNGIC